ncbi:ABC transporter permease [Candidatus Uabimicrobium amorphum]|uniref:ABC transporter permease n=1 Tax=Uabimicrobium amorphum TaxID=2596890 RepID=A0A5S9ILF7_UABAM|nr:ABC transporter permease [Candidatus Uabimicrobium amorphum]BBM83606.1 ABC transporter permease [Candidatus Uabimicrobium amorphum]
MNNNNNYITVLAPLVVFVLFVIIWHTCVVIFSLPPYLVPSPYRVFGVFRENYAVLLSATFLTAMAAIGGLLLSVVLGTSIALLFSQSKIIRQSLYPYAIFLQTVPIVAIAPLIVVWFGNGFTSVIVVAFIISLFPIITNGTMGLMAVKPQWIDLFVINNASSWQILFKLRFPNAVPYLLTGAKISSGLSVIGAIVGEFFAGYGARYHGLGYLITFTSGQMKTDYLFSAVFMSTILGLVFFGTLSLISNYILRKWE